MIHLNTKLDVKDLQLCTCKLLQTAFRESLNKADKMLKVINEIVEDMLNEILDNIENVSEDSLGLTLSDSDDQLPCSEDFQFFLNIARTVPSYSPGPETQSQVKLS